MDEMKIKSQFMTGILSKFIGDKIQKKVGYGINVHINEIETTVNNGKIRAHVDVDLDAEQAIISKILP